MSVDTEWAVSDAAWVLRRGNEIGNFYLLDNNAEVTVSVYKEKKIRKTKIKL